MIRINDLSDGLLERVLHEAAQGIASCRKRREVLQAVCRRWHAVIGRSSLFWATLRINLLYLSQPIRLWASLQGGPESQHALRWLDAKRGASHAIELRGPWLDPSALGLAEVLRRLGSQAVASLEVWVEPLVPSSVLQPFGEGVYPSLTRLILGGPASLPTTVRPLEHLPLLRFLRLGVSHRAPAVASLEIWQLTQLRQLELCQLAGSLCLQHVPEYITQLTGLERLRVERGALGPFPASATGLTALHVVELQSVDHPRQAGVPTFFDTLALLPGLRQLVVDDPRQDCSPLLGLSMMEDLQLLQVRRCGWAQWLPPAPAGAWPRLTCLKVHTNDEGRNTAATLPLSWCEACTNLRRLSFMATMDHTLEPIPAAITKMSNLEELEVKGYHAHQALPRCVELPNLTKLVVHHVSSVAEVNWVQGTWLGRLQALDLSGSNFDSLPAGLCAATALRSLRLSHCRRLQLVGGPPSSVSVQQLVAALPELTQLVLAKTTGDTPGQHWSGASLEALLELARERPRLKVALQLPHCETVPYYGVSFGEYDFSEGEFSEGD